MVGSPVLFHLAKFGWKDEVHHLIISHEQYASYLSLYYPFSGFRKAQGAKKECAVIGFKIGTEKFGNCVMKLMDRP